MDRKEIEAREDGGETSGSSAQQEAIKALDHWWNLARESAIKSLNTATDDNIESISSAIVVSS